MILYIYHYFLTVVENGEGSEPESVSRADMDQLPQDPTWYVS